MNDQFTDIRDHFLAALERDDLESQLQYAAMHCAELPDIRAKLEEMLRAHHQSGGFLASRAEPAATINQPPREQPGTLIGPYKLLEQIGEGGMGLVYMAEQQRPMRRLVALKLIKPGMDSKQVIARFEAEKQALAMMDHENIAKVFEAGTTDAGRFYFAMELVRGIPINEFCDQKRLSVRERLALFIQVCQAVQHAHQKGIIHRDLKPSNVLVTMHDVLAVPKVIDFGIAKALGQQLTDSTLHTGFAQLVGTPLYMSPEQAEMNQLGVDTRSDVYSLGVLLYELLTGTTPFDKETLSKAGLDEMRRMIREDDPLRPSARMSTLQAPALSTISQRRSTDPRRISATLRGELDWIVMKALEKDRSRRYESASALATDIQRYLSDEPVLACPPTTMYRFQKFARKHKAALTTAVAIAVCLLLGTTVSAWQAVRATTAEAQATANEAQAQEKAKEASAQRNEARQQRDEAQKQRDEVKGLNDKLAAKDQQLQRTLYNAHINLAQRAWDAGAIRRVNQLLDQHRPKPGETDLRGFEWHYLRKLGHGHDELFMLEKPHARNWRLSPDGTRLALGGGVWDDSTKKYVSGEVTIVDLRTGQELWTRKGHGNLAIGAGFSPDGKRLVSWAWDATLKVWDATTGQELHTFTANGLSQLWGGCGFSPDGKRLVCTGGRWDDTKNRFVDPEAKVLDAETGEELLSLKGEVDWMAFSPDGKRLAGVTISKVIVWDPQSGQKLLSLSGGDNMASFSPDGKKIAAGPKVFDLQTGEELLAFNGVGSVGFSPDGKRLVGFDKELKVFNAQTGKELLSIPAKRGGTFSPDGKRLAVGTEEGEVQIWDAETGALIRSFNRHAGQVKRLRFIQDGARLASLGGGTLRVWEASTIQESPAFYGANSSVRSLGFSADFTRIAGIIRDSMTKEVAIKLWDAKSGQELLSLKPPAAKDALVGSAKYFPFATISPDGKRLAYGPGTWDTRREYVAGDEVKVWDSQTGRELVTFKGHTLPVTELEFSPDSSRLISCGNNPAERDNDQGKSCEVKVWDAANGQELLALPGHTSYVVRVAYSQDGKRLATLSLDNTLKVWDAQTGRELLSLPVLVPSGGCVVFSPDGNRLASSSQPPNAIAPAQGGEIKLWNAQTGEELLTLQGHAASVKSLVFSPDGKRLASAAFSQEGRRLATGEFVPYSSIREIKLWDAQTGEELLTLDKPGGNRIAFSPNGHLLATAGAEGLKIFDATPLPEKP